MIETTEADRLISALALEPHPEGGHYRETWRHEGTGGRGSGSAIYYLLKQGEVSAWHRIDAAEIWHHYGGAALELCLRQGLTERRSILGPGIDAGERPQIIVPKGTWQTAKTLGRWTLVGCTVSPAFEFAGFELAPKDGPGG